MKTQLTYPVIDGQPRRGIELKVNKGVVVVPPSMHAAGNPYRWLNDRGPDVQEITVAPEWLLDIVRRATTEKRNRIHERDEVYADMAEQLANGASVINEGYLDAETLTEMITDYTGRDASRQSDGSFTTCCPVHGEEHDSLHVSDGYKGTVTTCFVGCSNEEVCNSLGIEQSRLFPTRREVTEPVKENAVTTCTRRNNATQAKPQRDVRSLLMDLGTVEVEEVTWLWRNHIPKAKLSSVEGEPGVGKSSFLAHLCACITTGKGLPRETEVREPGHVIYFQREDGVEDTLLPRFLAAGGDKHRMAVVPEPELTLAEIESCIAEYKPVLVVFDPIQSFLDSSVDPNRMNQVRRALEPYMSMMKKYDCAGIIVRHFNKEATNPKGGDKERTTPRVGKGNGSIDFDGSVRSIFQLIADPDVPGLVRVDHAKCNIAPKQETLYYHLETDEYYKCAVIRWADQTLPKTEEEFILDLLESGAREYGAIKNAVAMVYDDVNGSKFQRTMKKLEARGLVEKAGHGMYRRV